MWTALGPGPEAWLTRIKPDGPDCPIRMPPVSKFRENVATSRSIIARLS